MNSKRLVIIDGNSLIFRAYYAIQRPMITKSGQYTHGIYGFLNMLSKIEKEYEPGYIAVSFDLAAPTFRHKEYSEYKATRKKMPPELAMQMEPMKEVLRAMNIRILEMEGFEGDDIIGTVARRGEKEGLEPLIITGDRDALQLATDVTKVLITKKGISEFELFDAAHMQEVYGMSPAQFIDYKALRGDTSDNIPGLPGVGEKTAQKLIADFESVDNLLDNIDKIQPAKLQEKVRDNREIVLMSRRLATINCEVPIDFKMADLQVKEPDFEKLINLYVQLEFNSFLKKLQSGASGVKVSSKSLPLEGKVADRPDEVPASHAIWQMTPHIITGGAGEVEEILRPAIEKGYPVCITSYSDDNHRGVPAILGFGFAVLSQDAAENADAPKATAYFIKESDKAALEALTKSFAEHRIPIIGHNLKADYYALLCNFGLVAGPGSNGNIFNTAFDTSIAEYLLNPTAKDYLLNILYMSYFGKEMRSMADFDKESGQLDMFSDKSADYAAFAAEYIGGILSVYNAQKAALEREGLTKVAEKIEFPLVEVMASMEKEGFMMNADTLAETGRVLDEGIEKLTREIYALAGEEFNINSTQQLGVILFEKMGLPAGKKTKTGYSTSAEVLEKIRDEYPEYEIVSKILEYRTLSKLSSTYIQGLIPLQATDGRIHAHFQQTVTATGRISCTEPNLQNIPVRQEIGRTIRKAFIPSDDDHILVGADYSQIELRVLAHLSQEEHLIEAFNSGADIHRMTASKVFGIPFDEVTSLERSRAKAVNFGVIYGMSGFGLASELNISRKSAEKYIKDYFAKYTKVKAFMDGQVAKCKATGYSETMCGRKRAIPEISASNFMVRQFGERLAMNTPIQGSAADIIKLAMISVYRALSEQRFKSRLILQVHDELIIDARRDELERVTKLLKECMEGVMKLSVELVAEPETGENWYELK